MEESIGFSSREGGRHGEPAAGEYLTIREFADLSGIVLKELDAEVIEDSVSEFLESIEGILKNAPNVVGGFQIRTLLSQLKLPPMARFHCWASGAGWRLQADLRSLSNASRMRLKANRPGGGPANPIRRS